MKRFSSGLSLAVCLAFKPALAEDPERPWHSSERASIPITIENQTTTTSYTILGRNGEGAVDTCDRECTVWLEPGRYVLRVHERAGYGGADKALEADEPRTYVVTQGRSAARSTGLGLGITGTVLLALGMFAITPAALSSMCHGDEGDCQSDETATLALAGLGGLVVGAVLTPVGWSMFARNRVHLRPVENPGG